MDAMVKQNLALLDAVEARMAPNLEKILFASIVDMLRQAESGFTAFQIPPEFRRPLINTISAIWWQAAEGQINLMADTFKEGFPTLTHKDDRQNEVARLVDAYASSYGSRRAAQILTTTEKQTQALIRGGMARGESAATVINSALESAPATAGLRSLLITRTESHAASQFAAFRLAQQSNIALNKIWNTTVDQQTRRLPENNFDHLIMNGQEVSLLRAFQVPTSAGGVERLQYPGDPSGSAGNVINCRCIQTFRRQE